MKDDYKEFNALPEHIKIKAMTHLLHFENAHLERENGKWKVCGGICLRNHYADDFKAMTIWRRDFDIPAFKSYQDFVAEKEAEGRKNEWLDFADTTLFHLEYARDVELPIVFKLLKEIA